MLVSKHLMFDILSCVGFCTVLPKLVFMMEYVCLVVYLKSIQIIIILTIIITISIYFDSIFDVYIMYYLKKTN